jgi:choline-sulfatase
MSNANRPPNILLFVVDQLRAFTLPSYGGRAIAPNIESLIGAGSLFESAYCNYPLCAPSRSSFLTGRLASEVDAFDNAAPLGVDQPTLAHYLRQEGYYTCLVGKMHFTGPDQLHGYEVRRTTDIYPANYSWTADWSTPADDHVGAGLEAVVESGICRRSMQIDFDEHVTALGVQEIFDIARYRKDAPFFLTVSLSHPHNPYTPTEEFASLYNPSDFVDPAIRFDDLSTADPYTSRLWRSQRRKIAELSNEEASRARQCYLASVSYADSLFGRVMAALRKSGQDQNTVIVFTTDHGEMLGDRGLWFKSCHFEGAARIPLVIAGPGFEAGHRIGQPVSLLDLFPTILKSVDNLREQVDWQDYRGRDLRSVGRNDSSTTELPILGEYTAQHTLVPRVMVRLGRHKYLFADDGEELLYDLAQDPWETKSIADENTKPLLDEFRQIVARTWNLDALKQKVISSQKRRLTVHNALRHGAQPSWNYEPHIDAQEMYVRNDIASVEKRRARL